MKSLSEKLLLVLFVFTATTSFSMMPPPGIQGPGTVYAGTAYTYSFTYGYIIAPTWQISSGSATINSTWLSGSTYYASITWTSSGTVAFFDEVSEIPYVTKAVAILSAPTPTHGVRCGTGTVSLSATPGSGGDKVRWYSTLTGGTHFSESLTFTTTSISTTTTYYIETWNSGTSQPSIPRIPITATVGPVLNQPASVTQATGSCGSSAVSLTGVPASSANSINWYSSPRGGEPVYTGTTYVTPVLTTSTAYYAASVDTISGCISGTRVPVMAVVNQKPGATGGYQLTNAYGSGSVDLWTYLYADVEFGITYVDTTFFQVSWYATEANALAGTSRLATGVLFHTPSLTQTTKFYTRMRDKTTNCLGDVNEVTATIIPFISAAKIQTDVIRVTGKKTELSLAPLTAAEKSTSVIYLDGIGRTRQQIAVKASQAGKDIVMPMEYDNLGRSSKNYLPYAGTTTDGSLHSAYVTEQFNFYQAPNDKVANDSLPFAISKYEDTPDARLIEQGGVGKAWQPGNGHTSRIKYGFNTGATSSEAEEVRKFNSDGSSSGFYAAKTVHRTEYTNAMGNKEIVFTNSAGQVIVKKTQLDKTTEGVMVNYLQTYYCYDDGGRVKSIIQPKGVVALKTASWVISQSLRDQYMFQFTYDQRGRLIAKKVPGAGWEYIVYDQMNRPVLTQDANIRTANQWNFIKYDGKGRVVMTGLYTDAVNTTRAAMQGVLDSKNYDASDKYFEVRQATTHGYSSQAFPTANTQILTVNYYDDHDFNYDVSHEPDYTYTVQPDINSETAASSSLGLATGSKVLIVGTSNWLTSAVFHDALGRVIQVKSNNQLSASIDNVNTMVYDFEKVTLSKTYHNTGGTNVTIVKRPVYDSSGRISKIFQKLNGGSELLVAKYEYNELGQMVDKKLNGTGTPGSETFLQSVDYRYTIGGQLQSINNPQLNTGADNDETNDYFGLELLYNDASDTGLGNTARFDGNISAIKWKAPGDGTGTERQRSFQLIYDKSNKLESATSKVRGAATWDKESNAQNESMTYDLNGNIKTLLRNQRKHQLVGTVASYINEAIDNLTYTYTTSDANKLAKVEDAAGNTNGFNNGSTAATEYTYDATGSLLTDNNKGVSSTTYNHLGKPTKILFTDGKKITYVYDAAGNKLTMRTFQGTTRLNTTHYVNGFVYDSTTLNFFGSPEGRVVKNGAAYEYQYSIADHQGNTRVVFTSATPTAQSVTATFESAVRTTEAGYFTPNSYPNTSGINPVSTNNHTPGGTSSQYLNGGYVGMVGVTKSYSVYPGDKVKIEAYARYNPVFGSGSSLASFTGALLAAFNVAAPGPGEVGTMSSGLTVWGDIEAGGYAAGSPANAHPKAFVNIILFDKDYKFLDVAYQQVTSSGAPGYVTASYTVKEAGYAFVYVSNEHPTKVDVYFDDVTMTYTPGNIIQYNEYYPFGLQTSASWTRVNNKNNFLYNAANELNPASGWYETFFRGYDPALGRFLQVDPLAHQFSDLTAYNYAGNDPVNFNDPNGDKVSGGNMFSRMYEGFHAWEGGRSAQGFDNWMNSTGLDGINGLNGAQGYYSYEIEIWESWYHSKSVEGKVEDKEFLGYVYKVGGVGDLPGSVIPGIKILNFGPLIGDTDNQGVYIRLGYNDPKKRYSEYRWIQTVRTNMINDPDADSSPFNDAPKDGTPYYWLDGDEMDRWTNKDGFSTQYMDNAGRANGTKDVYWQAELTIGGMKDGVFIPLGTMTYGFTFDKNGKFQINPIQVIQPSEWHLNSFTNKSKW